MARTAIMVLVTLALAACGTDDGTSAESATSVASTQAFDAFIEYGGRRYEMVVPGDCGARPDGTYRTWAATRNADGVVDPRQAHLFAMRAAHWSMIDFYSPDDRHIVRIYREGRDRFGFDDGVLEFEGELGAGLTDWAHVRIICPE